MSILIRNTQENSIEIEKIRYISQFFLNDLGYNNFELSILIVNNLEISQLNKKYLNNDNPTNVLAFPMYDKEEIFSIKTQSDVLIYILGDIVISIDTVIEEAKLEKISIFERFVKLLIHGLLHLLGYDHERSEQDYIKMEKETNRLFFLISKEINLN